MNKWFFLIVIFDFGGSRVCWSSAGATRRGEKKKKKKKKKKVKIKL
jgi:hypothetical protein